MHGRRSGHARVIRPVTVIEGYSMIKFSVGDNVTFARDVVRRTGNDSSARGTVVAVSGPGISGSVIVSVDFEGSWIPHEFGGTVRHVPAANLTKLGAHNDH